MLSVGGCKVCLPTGQPAPQQKEGVMRSPEQLLASIKENRAKRLQELARKEKSQLIDLIIAKGHFESVDADIAWLEKRITEMEAK